MKGQLVAILDCAAKDCAVGMWPKTKRGEVRIYEEGIRTSCSHKKENENKYLFSAPWTPGFKVLWKNEIYWAKAQNTTKNVSKSSAKKRFVTRRNKYSLCFLHGFACPNFDWREGNGRCF